jgi:hypothetical protein
MRPFSSMRHSCHYPLIAPPGARLAAGGWPRKTLDHDGAHSSQHNLQQQHGVRALRYARHPLQPKTDGLTVLADYRSRVCAASSPSTNDDGRYILLQSDNGDGDFLTVGADGLLSTTDVLDDGSLWRRTADGFVSATHADVAVGATPTPREGPAMLGEQDVSPVKLLLPGGKKVSAEGGECPTNVGGNYTVFGGPLRKLSEYDAEFREKGYCVAEALVVPEVLEHLAEVFARCESEREEARAARSNPSSGNFWMMDMMKEDPAMIRMCANPVALSVMRAYFGTKEMGYGHSPIVNTMKPVQQAPELTPGSGW